MKRETQIKRLKDTKKLTEPETGFQDRLADKKIVRCGWVGSDPIYIKYHDTEWGVPVGRPSNTNKFTPKSVHASRKNFSSLNLSSDKFLSEKILSASPEAASEQELIALKARLDDQKQFEFLVLESAQAGLSWITILKRREGYRRIFHNFEPEKVSKMSEQDIDNALCDSGIIRNRLKVNSTVKNARVFLEIQKEFGTFNNYIWKFVGDKPKVNAWKLTEQVPATSTESDALSKDLKKRGMTFVGSTIIYAHMQAVGMVNDHTTDCCRYKDLSLVSEI